MQKIVNRNIVIAAALVTLGLNLLVSNIAHATLKEVVVHPNQRYLMYADGSPFFFLGDTQWRLSHHGTREEIDQILDNRQSKGFTAIQIPANFIGVAQFGHLDDWQPLLRRNVYGHLAGAPDNWNEDYWQHMDYTVDAVIARGMHPILFPAWGTMAGGALNIFSSDQEAYDYGVYFANRYKDRAGIIYVVGGDRDPHSYVASIAQGIKATDPSHLISFHPLGGHSSSEGYHNESWLDFNSIQTGHHVCDDNQEFDYVNNLFGIDRNLVPTKPVTNIEPRYEGYYCQGASPPFNDNQSRVSTYWSVFAGSFGMSYAHHRIWSWGTDWGNGSFNTNQVFEFLDSPASFQLQHLKNLMLSRPFFSRIPDSSITDGQNGIAATRGDGYIMAYFSRGQTASINTASLAGKQVKAWWYNAKDGSLQSAGTITGGGSQSFNAPGSEGSGNDWVLVLDDSSRGFPNPGTPFTEGYDLAHGEWKQVSLPCEPDNGDTISNIFADDIAGALGSDWAI